jgi:flagellar biosynthetic protein FliO
MHDAPPRRPNSRLVPLLLLLLPCTAHATGAEGMMGTMAPSTFALVARALGSLAGVVALIALLALLFRRLRVPGPARAATRRLRSVERLDLGGRRELRVVRAGGRTLVLGVTEQRIDLLTELDDVPGEGAEASPSACEHDESAAGSGTPVLRVLRKLATSA